VGKPEEFERIIEELPNKPFLVGEEGVSMSLAGAQTKLAVAVDDTGRVCIPMNGSPSTHILKPDSPRLWGGVQNEAFCLTLARRMKIPTPDVTTGQAGKRTYLLVQRYDRTDVGGRWRRLFAIHDRIRLRYHTLKLRALIWVLRRQRAVDYRSTDN
jgi:serine/threonine-protein kinase HipA